SAVHRRSGAPVHPDVPTRASGEVTSPPRGFVDILSNCSTHAQSRVSASERRRMSEAAAREHLLPHFERVKLWLPRPHLVFPDRRRQEPDPEAAASLESLEAELRAL